MLNWIKSIYFMGDRKELVYDWKIFYRVWVW